MIFDDFSLKGKTALVTGGGNGIGSGITKGLAEAGASIACVYRTRPPVEMQRYVEGLGRRFLPIQADVGQMPQLKAIMEQTLNAFGRLDILVNNAGICPVHDVLSGRNQYSRLHRQQVRGNGDDPPDGQRMGQSGDQCKRHCSRMD